VKYRHSYHAGNFADVHKHVTLLALLRALQRKPKGFLYVDTHAGAGSYDLGDASTRHGAEARGGLTALEAAPEPRAAELRDYLQAVGSWRARCARAQACPGSPALAALTLRAQDHARCCEQQSADCRALEHALAGFPGVRVACDDGYRYLAACLPARERRALVLIDPPYESASAEIGQAMAAMHAALERMANTVIALWYPIKDERWLDAWQQRLPHELSAPASILELWLYPRDAAVALNGSGLLIVNPPYRIAERAEVWQPELLEHLRVVERPDMGRAGEHAGSRVRTLIGERPARRAGA
jgi:23S rRNA (adenine2030-N6)-methyltransferase